MRRDWLEAVNRLTAQAESYVLVTLLSTKGSTPREGGTKMVVTNQASYATIGGGHLEYQAIARARKMLVDGSAQTHIERFLLGPNLGQCCGGSTVVLFERFTESELNLMLFGAGHVGRALVSILAELPCRVTWVDSREAQFPQEIPINVKTLYSEEPEAEIASMPHGSYYLVMTHNHQLDFDICETIFKRGDFQYLGLIGSETKRRRFDQRFRHRGYPQELVAKLRCPVGLSVVPGKKPMEVAVSIAAELIALYHDQRVEQPQNLEMSWRDLQSLLPESVS